MDYENQIAEQLYGLQAGTHWRESLPRSPASPEGLSANFVVSDLDPLLAGLTQEEAALLDKDIAVNPLCNYYFTASSSLLIILAGWFVTDRER